MRISDWSSDVCSSDLAALHAGLLAEAEPRPVLVVEQRAGGAGGDAGEAEGAARSVDGDAAEGRARRQRQQVDRRRRLVVQVTQREEGAAALEIGRAHV